MNFEIRRFKDMQLILKVLTLWVFIQVLRDIISYAVMIQWFPMTLISRVAKDSGYPITASVIFIGCAICILPYFIISCFSLRNKYTRPLGRLAVYALFALTLKWLSLLIYVRDAEGGGLWMMFVYAGNMIEVAALASVLAWNMNQYLKYESDYGLIPKVPTSSEFSALS